MRKSLQAVFALFCIVIFASCSSKDYTCTCTYNTGGVIQKSVITIPHSTKSQAEDQCSSSAAYHPEAGIGKTKITCALN
jgi:hypothetical protein